MKKRFVSLLACGVLAAGAAVGFAGCGDDGAIKLTLWGPEAQQSTLTQMVEKFKEANPDAKYKIKVGVCGEDMAFSKIGTDPSAGPDVFAYSNDQLVPLLRSGALAQIGGSYLTKIQEENSAESIASGTFNDKVYGYPYASDNGCFMYYDKSVFPNEEDLGSLETIISTCKAAENKKIAWAIDEPWYTAGWFFAFGCTYKVKYENAENEFVETSVEIDFNNEGGLDASRAIAKLTSEKSVFAGKGTNNGTILDGFTQGKTAVAVSGTWNAKSIQQALGDNYGVCKLPTVTVNGTTKQLYSFTGFKLYGVNKHSKSLAEAHKLAQFLSGKEMQQERFEKHLVGPTNKALAETEDVKNDATLAVLKAQNAYSVEQVSVPSNFWNPLKAYGGYLIDGLVAETASGTVLSYQAALNTMVANIKSSITSS